MFPETVSLETYFDESDFFCVKLVDPLIKHVVFFLTTAQIRLLKVASDQSSLIMLLSHWLLVTTL